MSKLLAIMACHICVVCIMTTHPIQDGAVKAKALVLSKGGFDQHDVRRAIGREMEYVQVVTGMGDDSVKLLEAALDRHIYAEVHRFNQRSSSSPQWLSADFEKIIAAKVANILDDNALADAYSEDLAMRRRYKQRNTRLLFIDRLDRTVGLTAKQLSAIEEIGETGFHKLAWSKTFSVYKQKTGLHAVLTETQLDFLYALGAYQPVNQYGASKRYWPRRMKLRNKLNVVATMKSELLQAELNLTPLQVEKLSTLARSVVTTAADQQMSAFFRLTSDPEWDPMDSKRRRLQSADPVMLFDAQDRWSRLVRDLLTDEQKVRYEAIVNARVDRLQQVIAFSIVRALQKPEYTDRRLMMLGAAGPPKPLTLTGKQQEALHKLLATSTDPYQIYSLNSDPRRHLALLDVADEDYLKAIGEQNWAILKPKVATLRAQQ